MKVTGVTYFHFGSALPFKHGLPFVAVLLMGQANQVAHLNTITYCSTSSSQMA